MDVVVFLKAIPDPAAPPESFVFDGGRPDTSRVPVVLGPFEENALELGLRVADGTGGSLRVLAMGGQEQDKSLRTALALGASAALRVDGPPSWADPLVTARLLSAGADRLGSAQLYLTGRQAGDWDRAVTGALLAGLRGLPYLPKVFDAVAQDGGLRISQEVEGGVRTGMLRSAAVLTATNAPSTLLRMANVRDLLLAARKPVDVVDAASLLEEGARTGRLADEGVSARRLGRAGRRVAGDPPDVAKALLAELAEHGVVPGTAGSAETTAGAAG